MSNRHRERLLRTCVVRGALMSFVSVAVLSCSGVARTPVGLSGGCCRVEEGRSLGGANLFTTNLGWHTGIVLPGKLFPELSPYVGEGLWYEFGWGDRDFYQSSSFSLGLALNALVSSDGSAIQVVPIPLSPHSFFENALVVSLRVDERALTSLAGMIQSEFARTDARELVPLAESLYGRGRFFEAHREFSGSFSCNSWIALLLSAVGCSRHANLVRASSLNEEVEALPLCD